MPESAAGFMPGFPQGLRMSANRKQRPRRKPEKSDTWGCMDVARGMKGWWMQRWSAGCQMNEVSESLRSNVHSRSEQGMTPAPAPAATCLVSMVTPC